MFRAEGNGKQGLMDGWILLTDGAKSDGFPVPCGRDGEMPGKKWCGIKAKAPDDARRVWMGGGNPTKDGGVGSTRWAPNLQRTHTCVGGASISGFRDTESGFCSTETPSCPLTFPTCPS